MPKVPISVLILTYNEEIHLDHCLRSVVDWADEVVVVDSFSTDGTADIARRWGVRFVEHEFAYPALQKNWALENLPFRNEWLLLLDADERVPDSLAREIADIVDRDGAGKDGYWMRYRLIFFGKWIRHCGWYPTWILRLVRHRKARFEDRLVDEHPVVGGTTGRTENDLLHVNLHGMTDWIAKHNRYSTANAAIAAQTAGESASGIKPQFFGSQAERKRFIKERIWPRLPGRAIVFFVYMYVFRLGFLDGVHGLVFCIMHGIFQEFTVVKLWEARMIRGNHAGEDRIAAAASPTQKTR